jgi:hypothetical protein
MHTQELTLPSSFSYSFFEMETHIVTSLFGFIFKFEKGILFVLTDLKTFSVSGRVYRGGGDTFGKQKINSKKVDRSKEADKFATPLQSARLARMRRQVIVLAMTATAAQAWVPSFSFSGLSRSVGATDMAVSTR